MALRLIIIGNIAHFQGNLRACALHAILYPMAILASGAISGCGTGVKPNPASAHAISPLSAADSDFHGVGFVDATTQTAINFVHSTGQMGSPANLLQSNGGGIALLDYDGDGLLDAYFVTGIPKPPITGGTPPAFQPQNRLYHNNGNGTFSDVTDASGTAIGKYCSCVAVADYDNDGRPDIFVGAMDGPNALLHNNGNGTFTDVSEQAGVADRSTTLGATWLDYDNDGKLDIYVGNYVHYDPTYKYFYNPDGYPGPLSYEGAVGKLYHNEGNGKFRDVTHEMGMDLTGRAMGVASCDYDGDGYPDIYVANDSMPKYLFHNEKGKRFTEVGRRAGCAFNMNGEGVASMMGTWGDYDNDGQPDLFVPDATFKSLFHNLGSGLFQDVTADTGIAAAAGQYVSWGSGWVDYDNDGDEDLIIMNGAFHHLYGEEGLVLHNNHGKFDEVSDELGPFFKRKIDSRGTAFGDYNNDGVTDVFLSVLNDKAIILKGQNPNGNHWLGLRLVGSKSNRDGIGSAVTVKFGGKTRYAWRVSGGAYLSDNDPRLHFGLGKSKQADEISIRWPSGIRQTLTRVPADQVLAVQEPDK